MNGLLQQKRNKIFTLDNRDYVDLRIGTEDYVIDANVNRYITVGGNSLSYDDAGNLTTDKDGYVYTYDYENRIVKIEDGQQSTVAQFAYDALGRRIRKIDSIASANSRRYYYNDNWQVLTEKQINTGSTKYYFYGNYIDEVAFTLDNISADADQFYLHDHLYNTVAVVNFNLATIEERYEYDAYGKVHVMDASYGSRSASSYNNNRLFHGKELIILDNGSLKYYSYPYRDYSYDIGSWFQHEKLGMIPNDNKTINPFVPQRQYTDGMNIYQGVSSNPISGVDPFGLATWPALENSAYKRNAPDPEDSDWEHGDWKAGGTAKGSSLIKQLNSSYNRAKMTARAGGLFGHENAKRHLLNYLSNKGRKLNIHYTGMLQDCKDARDSYLYDIKNAMSWAETLAHSDGTQTEIVQLGHNTHEIPEGTEGRDWYFAIGHYRTWGKANVKKGQGRNKCCYYMTLKLHLRDNYEFQNLPLPAGFVYDDEMWLLNYHGIAKHFKIRGRKKISLAWPKGYRLEFDDPLSLIRGKQLPFPQCK